jgi:CubicO group peptidase (beta-lactamase class C family)
VRELLSHTSGLGDYLDDEQIRRHPSRFRVVDDFRSIARRARPSFEPGAGWRYSNLGFVIAGAVLQKVTGLDYDETVRRGIYLPAGMERSGCFATDRPIPDRALPYSRVEGAGAPRWEVPSEPHPVRGGPAGGCFSTVGDLWRFAEALRGGKLLPAAALDEMWTATPASRSQLPYGLGFAVQGAPGDRRVGHSGGFPGVSARFEMQLDAGFTLIALGNQDGAAEMAVQKLAELAALIVPPKPS